MKNKWPRVSKISIPDKLEDKPVSVFDLCLEYPNYDDIKEAVGKVDSMEEALSGFSIKWSVWGREELNNINLNELIFGADLKDKVTPNMMTNLNLSDMIIPSRANI